MEVEERRAIGGYKIISPAVPSSTKLMTTAARLEKGRSPDSEKCGQIEAWLLSFTGARG
jgi:hypothetical protein